MCIKFLRSLIFFRLLENYTRELLLMSTRIPSGVSCLRDVSEGTVCYKINIHMTKGVEKASKIATNSKQKMRSL